MEVGRGVIFLCNSRIIDSSNTKWFFDSGPTSEYNAYAERLDSSLRVFPARVNNSGIYTCHGLYKNKKKFFLAQAELKVFGKLIGNTPLIVLVNTVLLFFNV